MGVSCEKIDYTYLYDTSFKYEWHTMPLDSILPILLHAIQHFGIKHIFTNSNIHCKRIKHICSHDMIKYLYANRIHYGYILTLPHT